MTQKLLRKTLTKFLLLYMSKPIRVRVSLRPPCLFLVKNPGSGDVFSTRCSLSKSYFYLSIHRIFENGMILVILANSICLAFYDYNDRDSLTDYNKRVDKVNLVFTAIFIIEAVLRIIAHGFIMGKNAYLRSGWNIIDAAVVVSG